MKKLNCFKSKRDFSKKIHFFVVPKEIKLQQFLLVNDGLVSGTMG